MCLKQLHTDLVVKCYQLGNEEIKLKCITDFSGTLMTQVRHIDWSDEINWSYQIETKDKLLLAVRSNCLTNKLSKSIKKTLFHRIVTIMLSLVTAAVISDSDYSGIVSLSAKIPTDDRIYWYLGLNNKLVGTGVEN